MFEGILVSGCLLFLCNWG